MEEYKEYNTKKTNFTGLSFIKDQWEADRKQAMGVYREAIDNLAKCDYATLTARTLIANDRTDHTWIEQFYGIHAATVMRQEAWKTIVETKKRKAAINRQIQVSTKAWVRRNTIFALKALRAYQWANEFLTKNLVDTNPALARNNFASHSEWRKAVNAAKDSATIIFTWRDPQLRAEKKTTEKQSVVITIYWTDKSNKDHIYTASF